MTGLPLEQKRIVLHGRVQGVGFRFFARDLAAALALRGTVRNLSDGERVEVVVQGPPAQVARFISLLRSGPPSAAVHGVDVVDESPDPRYLGFEITR